MTPEVREEIKAIFREVLIETGLIARPITTGNALIELAKIDPEASKAEARRLYGRKARKQ